MIIELMLQTTNVERYSNCVKDIATGSRLTVKLADASMWATSCRLPDLCVA